MIRSTRRSAGVSRAVLASLTVVGGLALAGCGAGQQAQTAQQRPTVDGISAQVGPLQLRDVVIEYPEGGKYARGDDARLRMIVVNEGADGDALVEVRTDAADSVTFAATGTPATEEGTASPTAEPTTSATATATATASVSALPTTTPPAEPSGTPSGTPAGTPSATASPTPTEEPFSRIAIPGNGLAALRDAGPAIELVGLTRELRAAEVVRVTFVFEQAGELTVDVAVAVPDEQVPLAPTVPGEPEEG